MNPAVIDIAIMAMAQPTIERDRRAALDAFDQYAATIDNGHMLSIKHARECIVELAHSIRMGAKPDGLVGRQMRGKALEAVRALDRH